MAVTTAGARRTNGKATGRARRPRAAAAPAVSADTVEQAIDQTATKLRVPLVGGVKLPPLEHLAFYGVVGVMTAVELIEWPVALIIGAGKFLADSRTHKTLRSIGEALEDAS